MRRERLSIEDLQGTKLIELLQALTADPDLDELNCAERRMEARELCFQALKDNPGNTQVRLFLAKLFFLDGYGEFAVRELVELQRYTKATSLDRLLDSFGNFALPFRLGVQNDLATTADAGNLLYTDSSHKNHSTVPSQLSKHTLNKQNVQEEEIVIAEVDVDADFLDVLEELEKG